MTSQFVLLTQTARLEEDAPCTGGTQRPYPPCVLLKYVALVARQLDSRFSTVSLVKTALTSWKLAKALCQAPSASLILETSKHAFQTESHVAGWQKAWQNTAFFNIAMYEKTQFKHAYEGLGNEGTF